VGALLTLVVKSQWVWYKLDETIDNHDSWGTCTTSVECKTIITAALIVMSGMDPHMISGNMGWVFVKSLLGCAEVGFIRVWVGTVRLRDVIEASSLRSRVRYLFARLVRA
jgi:hypothetical protein